MQVARRVCWRVYWSICWKVCWRVCCLGTALPRATLPHCTTSCNWWTHEETHRHEGAGSLLLKMARVVPRWWSQAGTVKGQEGIQHVASRLCAQHSWLWWEVDGQAMLSGDGTNFSGCFFVGWGWKLKEGDSPILMRINSLSLCL